MAGDVCVRCTRGPECGVAGAFVCWEAGACVVVGKNAALSANTRGTEGLRGMQGTSRQGEEDPKGQRQGEVFWTMGKLCSGSDVQGMTFARSSVGSGVALNFWI